MRSPESVYDDFGRLSFSTKTNEAVSVRLIKNTTIVPMNPSHALDNRILHKIGTRRPMALAPHSTVGSGALATSQTNALNAAKQTTNPATGEMDVASREKR